MRPDSQVQGSYRDTCSEDVSCRYLKVVGVSRIYHPMFTKGCQCWVFPACSAWRVGWFLTLQQGSSPVFQDVQAAVTVVSLWWGVAGRGGSPYGDAVTAATTEPQGKLLPQGSPDFWGCLPPICRDEAEIPSLADFVRIISSHWSLWSTEPWWHPHWAPILYGWRLGHGSGSHFRLDSLIVPAIQCTVELIISNFCCTRHYAKWWWLYPLTMEDLGSEAKRKAPLLPPVIQLMLSCVFDLPFRFKSQNSFRTSKFLK